MNRRKITPSKSKKTKVRREREPISWKYVLLTAFCGLMLVVGFFGAARQHFASINYGIKNSKLKKEVEELKSEQRRLQLSKEVALSPQEIKKSAKKLGFTEMTASNIESFRSENNSEEKPNANKSSEPKVSKENSSKNKDEKAEIVKNKETKSQKSKDDNDKKTAKK